MTTRVERLVRDLWIRWEATNALEAAPGSELPSRKLRAAHSGGRLELPEHELALMSPEASRLARGPGARAADGRAEIAHLLTEASKGHFGVHVYPDGTLDLIPDLDGRRVLELTWAMAGRQGSRPEEPRLCAQCYKPLLPDPPDRDPEKKPRQFRRSRRYCSAKCRARAAYAKKVGGSSS